MALTTKRRRATRRPLALLAAGALAFTLTGCGGADGPAAEPSAAVEKSAATTSAHEVVSAAVARSVEDSTANFSLNLDTTAAGQSISASGNGQLDGERNAMSMQLTTQVPGQGTLTLQQVVVDGMVYLTGIPGTPQGQWVQVSLEELGAVGASGMTGGSDPSQQLQLLERVSDDVREAGSEKVNGVQATKYTGTIDLDEAADVAAEQGAGNADTLRQQYQKLGLTSIPFELYVDAEDRPVRMTTTVEATAEGQPVKAVSTIDFSDWGTDVTIQAPADAVPLSQVAGNSQG